MVFGEIMAQQKSGSIINYSSMSVDRVITRVVGYSASKAGIENFTRWMAVEMALSLVLALGLMLLRQAFLWEIKIEHYS